MRTGAGLGALLTIVLLSGCSSGGSPVTPSGISQAQAQAVVDQSVTSDEYEAGFQRFRTCLEKEGYALLLGDKQGYLVDYSIPDAAVQSGADEFCYTLEFQQVDMIWQLAHIDESDTTLFLKQCLIDRGIAPGDTREEIDQQLEANGLTGSDCE